MYTKVLVVMWENGLALNFVERRKQLLLARKKTKKWLRLINDKKGSEIITKCPAAFLNCVLIVYKKIIKK